MTGLLERYVLRQLIRPFLLGAIVVTFLLTMDFLFDYLDLFLNKGIDLLTVLRLFGLGLGWMLALSIPCGVLVGVLMAFGRLAQDNECTAMRASGIHLLRVLSPALGAGLLLAIGLTLFNNYVLPDMNHAFAGLLVAINKKRPTAEIQEGVFIDQFDGYNMFIGKLDDRTGRMQDVLIYDFSRPAEPPRTILARRGRLEFDAAAGRLSLHLESGEIHEAAKGASAVYRRMEFERQSLNIQGAVDALEPAGGRSRGQREMDIGEMRGKIAELLAEGDRYRERSRRVLDELGAVSVHQLPGMQRPSALARLLGALHGVREPRAPALPEEFWTPERRRQAEEAKVAHLQAQAAAKKADQYRVEIHKKFSIPAACVIFVLLGAPLGIRARRGGLAAGFLSAGFFVFYYLCLVGGEQLADRDYLVPWLAMWLPNLILGILGLALVVRVCEVRLPARPPWRAAEVTG
jgi:lipopolysaccharide export system permease protein